MKSAKPQRRVIFQIDQRILLPVFGALLIGALWLGLIYQLSYDRNNALKDAQATSQSMTAAFAEHVLNILRRVDFAEQIFKLNYEANKGQYPIQDFLRTDGVLNLALPPDMETLIMVLDANGQLIDSTQPFIPTSYAGEEFFRNHKDRTTDAMIVSKPVIDAASAHWRVQLSRRLNRANGGFAGVVVMQINPADFIDNYASSDAENQGAAMLISPIEKYSVRRVAESLVFEHSDFAAWLDPYHEKSVSSMLAAGELDGARRIFYSRTLAEFSLVAMVGITEQEALARFNQRRKTYVWIVSGITLLMIGFIAILMLQTARLQRSMSERRRAALAVAESESRLRTIANAVPAMVAYIEADQTLRFANMAFGRETGIAIDDLLGRHLRDTVSAERYAFLAPFITRVLQGETLTFEDEHERDGNLRCLETTFVPQFSERADKVIGFHVMRQDISSTKLEERRLQSLASLDPLTGLSNRNGFQLRLATAMANCRESGHLMALMYLDIDRFKPVNDTHGHQVGDALLRAFSSRLNHTVRSTDAVARLGGDEFTIILDQVSRPEDATMIANKIVHSMRLPFELDGLVVKVSASVGVAFYRGEDITSQELTRQADVMLYQAKGAGRDTFRIAALEQAISVQPESAA